MQNGRTRLTPEEKTRAQHLLDGGMSLEEVATRVGRSNDSIRRHCVVPKQARKRRAAPEIKAAQAHAAPHSAEKPQTEAPGSQEALTVFKSATFDPSQPTILVVDGVFMADSRDVALHFGKRHDNVIRDIEAKIRSLAELSAAIGLLKTEEPSDPYFCRTEGVNPNNGHTEPYYLMNRMAFVMLVMGFTGPIVIPWQLDYIRTFDRMEAVIRQPAPQPAVFDWSNPLHVIQQLTQAANLLIEARAETAEERAGRLAEKERADSILVAKQQAEAKTASFVRTDTLYNLTVASKIFNVQRNFLTNLIIHQLHWCYRSGNSPTGAILPYKEFGDKGLRYFTTVAVPLYHKDGEAYDKDWARLTSMGMAALSAHFNKPFALVS